MFILLLEVTVKVAVEYKNTALELRLLTIN